MTKPTRTIFTTCAICALLAALLAFPGRPAPAQVDGPKIVVLVSHDRAAYGEALAGFKEDLAQRGLQAAYTIYDLDGDTVRAALNVQQAKAAAPRLIFAIGALALQQAGREIHDIPIVAGMLLSEEDLHGIANATGVHLEIPYELQFGWLRRILPDVRTVGVVYSPEENQVKIEQARRIAWQQGIELVPQSVAVPRALPGALKNLENKVHALWGISDHVVLTPQTAKDILLFSFRSRIPFVGLSAPWVKAGALYALDRDYHDIGRQCGEIAYRLLQGETAGAIDPAPPRTVTYSLNKTTARRMNIDFPASLLRDATHLY